MESWCTKSDYRKIYIRKGARSDLNIGAVYDECVLWILLSHLQLQVYFCENLKFLRNTFDVVHIKEVNNSFHI